MNDFKDLKNKIRQKQLSVAVLGLGYVGLPLVYSMFSQGLHVLGLDVDQGKIDALNAGKSYLDSVDGAVIKKAIDDGLFIPSADFSELTKADFIVVCVPTPLDTEQQPDLSYVEKTTQVIAKHMRPGQIIILESTTYPGTMRDIVLPILERGTLEHTKDYFVAYSPEREDPGNKNFNTKLTPKIVSASTPEALELVTAFYEIFIDKVVPVSSMEVAEASKITENIFRAVNIALVNELKVIFDQMDINIWEVIDAASTKPFGFMPFYPGPGIGGHCIPIDPIYLTWKAQQYGISTRFIELASEINLSMTDHIIEKTRAALLEEQNIPLNRSKILVLGVAYKKNINDQRESPAFPLIERLEKQGAKVDFHDTYIPEILPSRHFPDLSQRKSIAMTRDTVKSYNAVIIVTDHDNVDYKTLAQSSQMVIDTRNALTSRNITGAKRMIRA